MTIIRNARNKRRKVARSAASSRRFGKQPRGRAPLYKPRKFRKKHFKGRAKNKFTMYDRVLGNKIRTRLTYLDTRELGPTSSSTQINYRLNSIFDPQYSVGGHQPAFHDQWALLYQRYRVVGCTWVLRFCHFGPNSGEHTLLTGTNAGEANALGDWNSAAHKLIGTETRSGTDAATSTYLTFANQNFVREMGAKHSNVQWRYMDANTVKRTIVGSVSMAQLYENDDSKEQTTLFGANPEAVRSDNLALLQIKQVSPDTHSISRTIIDVKLMYDVELSDPITVASS